MPLPEIFFQATEELESLNDINSGNNLIQGNYIGTTRDGTQALPNSGGILLNGASGFIIRTNLISGNMDSALTIFGGGNHTVQDNLIGTNQLGTQPLPNRSGVGIGLGSQNNLIGGPTGGDRNIISSNTFGAVTVFSPTSINNTIEGNYIGTDATGTAALVYLWIMVSGLPEVSSLHGAL